MIVALARRLLILPPGNPSIPAGDPKSVRTWNPGEGYLGYRLLGFWLGSLPLLLLAVCAAAGGAWLLHRPPRDLAAPIAWTPGLACLLAAAALVLLLSFIRATIHLELDMLRYTLTDRALRLRRGVVRVEEVTISYANVQNVQFVQGPVQRWYGIADLVVETAGGGVPKPGQEAGLAGGHRGLIKGVGDPERLRDLIVERVQLCRGAGLGDAREGAPAAAGGLDGPEARALLRQIRDGLAALAA